jgi:hypothetical protein
LLGWAVSARITLFLPASNQPGGEWDCLDLLPNAYCLRKKESLPLENEGLASFLLPETFPPLCNKNSPGMKPTILIKVVQIELKK